MRAELDHFRDWIRRIYATQSEEIDCNTLYDALARFVDLKISGTDAARLLPLVEQHLEQCPNCYELYDALQAVAQMEADGRLTEVPPPWEHPDRPGTRGVQPTP